MAAFANLHWLKDLDDEFSAGDAPLPTSADVVIVGGGYVGAATALWLARLGVQAILMERRGIATGATGRNAGFIAPGLGMSFATGVERYGESGAVERLAFTRHGRDLALQLIEEIGIDCDLEAPGGLTIASSAEEWQEVQRNVAALRKAGFTYELLDHGDLSDHFIAPAPKRFLGALFNPETLLVNPAKLSRGLMREAKRLGAGIFPHTEVWGFTDLSDGRIAVETARGAVQAARVVLATNAWSPLLAGFLKDRITPVRGQVFATAPAPPVFRRAMSTNWGYEYWSQRADGTIVLGG
ncbi:MAG: NAD(P)/FAD-dependent oxidoreductase, partial [Dehalococcoidia bacterium]